MRRILQGLRDELHCWRHAWRSDATGCGPTLEDFTDERSDHVPLEESRRWANSSRTEFYDLTSFKLDADVVRRAREEDIEVLGR